jgi:hypothetical protein
MEYQLLSTSFLAVPRASGPVFMFLRPDTFPAVPRASAPVLMFCAPELIFGITEGVSSRFHVLCAQTHFRRYRGRPIPFSYFARPDSFSAVRRASGPIFMFCTPGLVFGGTEGVGSRTHFQRYRGRLAPFSYFVLPDSFSAVPRAFGPVFMFCAPGFIFGGTEGVRSSFHVLRSPTCFRRFRGRRVLFSCFALLDTFSAVWRVSGPVLKFCVP